MSIRDRRPIQPLTLALVFLIVTLLKPAALAEEVRALWVVRTTLTSPESIDAMVASARDGGFDTVLVQVRGRGDAYFSGGIEPRAASLAGQPTSFDPLAHTIARAREAGLRVHAWMNVNLVAGLNELPPAPGHVVAERPEWLMVPRELADTLAGIDPSDESYWRHLAEFVETHPNEVEGLYLSPLTEAAAAYTTAVFADVARRYDVDGVHLDYARYPGDTFDYSRTAMDAFRASLADELVPDDRARFDERRRTEPAIYADAFPERWRAFRRDRMTELVARIRAAVKAARPDAVFSAAVFPDGVDAREHRFQDWPGWLERGLLDVICPMSYTTDAEVFSSQISAARALANRNAVWGGIGAYRLSAPEIVNRIRLVRSLDVGGIVLFSYDSLAETSAGPARVTDIGRAAFDP
jgi:uncharacterized lipoprotein YddW (UPF0748 family)